MNPDASPPDFGLIVIGDEILSGRRSDKHLAKVVELLGARGQPLAWAEYVGDEPARITATLRRAFASGAAVFSTGGIGATPDDHTRQCAAAALGVPLALHPEAKRLILRRLQSQARADGLPWEPERADNRQRLNMGVFPLGARIIPNPYNQIPGFFCSGRSGGVIDPDAGPSQGGVAAPLGGSAPRAAGERGGIIDPDAGPSQGGVAAPLGGSAPRATGKRGGIIYFVPGFPVMAWPMIEWVLDELYVSRLAPRDWQERSIIIFGAAEAVLTPVMERVEAAHPGVKVFSLPSVDHPVHGRHIDLGVKGAAVAVGPAFADLMAWLEPFGMRYGPELVRP